MSTSYPLDAAYFIKNRRKLKRALLSDGTARFEKKIAILCGSTVNDIAEFLEIFLLQAGIKPVFYLSEYNRYYEDAVFSNPRLAAFAPDIVYIHTTARNMEKYFPNPADTKEDAESLYGEAAAHLQKAWEKAAENFGAPMIQNNFEYPRFRLLGNRDVSDYRGGVHFINRLNAEIAAYAANNKNFYVNDVSYISACYGLDKWSDQAAWYMYKTAMAVEAMPDFAYNLANIIKAIFGKNKKALALDLDNTLWGGVVGDDGAENLEIGEETAEAQAYLDFQKYLKKVKDTGIMLTVNSKNDLENALAGLNHKESPLKPDDFLVIKANWEPKNKNLAEIAAKLNIGVDAMVFVDDNPAERHIVSTTLPAAAVPEMDGVENYIRVLDRGGYFESVSLSEDDLLRNEMYKANIKREKEKDAFGNYDDYLSDLKMTAEIASFIPVYIQRIASLTNKSNQFNLTTRRYTAAEIENAAADANHLTLYGKLSDRFGDNGVVSVVIGRKEGETLLVDLWLMSCRVLKRGMELAMLDTLVENAKAAGIAVIHGFYYPTSRNGMVKNHYETLGFQKVTEDEKGNSQWALPVAGYKKQNRFIEINNQKER